MGRGVGLGVAAGCAAVACAVAAVLVARRVRKRREWSRAVGVVRELEDGCATPASRLRQVVDAVAVEMHAGLASDGGSKLKMLLTFVDKLPNGSEKGTYYTVDLGGTNIRVLRVQLAGKREITGHQVKLYPIPQNLMTSSTEDLFEFIAKALKQFIDDEGNETCFMQGQLRELGFTFSFPLKQTSIASGTLIKWTKGFAIEDTIGKDVAHCLQEAISKTGLDMRIAALVNDTVGTLALGHYYDEDTVAAVILGTGTNACYMERTDAIIKCQGHFTNSGTMVINMEWGNFWSSHLPRTHYDGALDDDSPNRGEQGFEKMISGLYLGEIVRRVLLRVVQVSDILGDDVPKLSVPFILRTPLVAAMHEDSTSDLREVMEILRETLQISEVPLKMRRLVVKVCDVVTRRAARLAAAGIVGILKKTGRDGSGGVAGGRPRNKTRRTVVAVEGSLYASYPIFREYLHEAVAELLGDEVARNVVLRACQDGSGTGAAFLAASHSAHRGSTL